MKKIFLLLVSAWLLAGCNVHVDGPFNEDIILNLPDSNEVHISLRKKGGELWNNMWVHQSGSFRARYIGGVYWSGRETTYTFVMKQNLVEQKLSPQQKKLYTDVEPIHLEIKYLAKQKQYSVRLYDAHCPALNMEKAKILSPHKKKKEYAKPKTGIGRALDKVAGWLADCRDSINRIFNDVFGGIHMKSHWWFLFYVFSLLIMAIGLKFFTPLVWVGIIMEYAYLLNMSPVFFPLWPSIVGWGWMLVSVIPVILIIGFNMAVCVATVLKTFTSFGNFIILLIPAFIALLSIFFICQTAIIDHMELILLFLVSMGGESWVFVGYFVDNSGNVWKVYRRR